jgi:hypothetical protein
MVGCSAAYKLLMLAGQLSPSYHFRNDRGCSEAVSLAASGRIGDARHGRQKYGRGQLNVSNGEHPGISIITCLQLPIKWAFNGVQYRVLVRGHLK